MKSISPVDKRMIVPRESTAIMPVRVFLWMLCIALITLALIQPAQADMPKAGVILEAYAVASYKGGSAQSLHIKTTVAQVAGVVVSTTTPSVEGNKGSSASLSYELKNTGNGSDDYNVSVTWEAANVRGVRLIPLNKAGEKGRPVTLTNGGAQVMPLGNQLDAGDKQAFVLDVSLAPGASGSPIVNVKAVSKHTSAVHSEAHSTITLTDEATFSISQQQKTVPAERGEEVEISFEIKNQSTKDGMVALEGALAKLFLNEASFKLNDTVITSVLGASYKLAYDVKDKADKFKLALNVPAHNYVRVSFKAKIADDAKVGEVTSSIKYKRTTVNSGDSTKAAFLSPAETNTLLDVLNIALQQKHDVKITALTGTTDVTRGKEYFYEVKIKNTGLTKDAFTLLINPAAGLHASFMALAGTSDGTHTTEEIEPGKEKVYNLRATLDKDAAKSTKLKVTATSVGDTAKSDSKELDLKPTTPTVLLTSKVAAVELIPGTSKVVELTVVNNSMPKGFADSYRLFADAKKASGVSVTFHRQVLGLCSVKDIGSVDMVTKELASVEETADKMHSAANTTNFETFCATITTSQELKAGASINFQVKSDNTGAAHTLAVALNARSVAALHPNFSHGQSGGRGQQVIYHRTVKNAGGVAFAKDILALEVESDWTVDVYSDPGKTLKIASSTLLDKKLPEVPSGGEITLLIVVNIPDDALIGKVNNVKFTLKKKSGPKFTDLQTLTDLVTASSGVVSLKKTVTVTPTCGTSPAPGEYKGTASDVEPGQCVWYKVELENTGAAAVEVVNLADYFPNESSVEAPELAKITITGTPAKLTPKVDAVSRTIRVEILKMDPNDKITMTYPVKVREN